jgi:putative membrane protein
LKVIREVDSVSSIHKRWFFTLINPSSYKTSLIVYELTAAIIVCIYQILTPDNALAFGIDIAVAISVVSTGIFLDYVLLRGTPVNKISKVIHVSAFANLLWVITIILGMVTNLILAKTTDISAYIIAGMFMAIGLRYGIFVSVFGAGILRSIGVAVFIPLIFLIVFLPYSAFNLSYLLIATLGIIIISIGIIWSFLADRSGRPEVKSTFEILQAFLSAWTDNRQERMERIFESRASVNEVSTQLLVFKSPGREGIFLILPEVHPGPFSAIGGSNLPYRLFNFFQKRAIIFHSISDHSLNLPSSSEVEKYLETMKFSELKNDDEYCSPPIQINAPKFTITGIAFSAFVLILVSKNTGMEDLPFSFRSLLEDKLPELGLSGLFLVDAHNGIGEKITSDEEKVLADLTINCLSQLKDTKRYNFKISYTNTASGYPGIDKAEDIGESGLGVVGFEIDGKHYIIGWADSNNLSSGLRDKILGRARQEGINMLEIISSDTHSTSGKRTRQGYYSLGDVTNHNLISNIFLDLSEKSQKDSQPSRCQVFHIKSKVKLMGQDQFNRYSKALDKSMNISKVSLAITAIIYIVMLVMI